MNKDLLHRNFIASSVYTGFCLFNPIFFFQQLKGLSKRLLNLIKMDNHTNTVKSMGYLSRKTKML
jgi:hypothetical protein